MYEGFPGEVKTFFVGGLVFCIEEVFSSALVQGALGSMGCSSPLGAALHLFPLLSAFRRFPSTK